MSNKVLIIEDEPALVAALSDTFVRESFDVTVARDGKEGLAMALATHPDMILLDLIMPVMDGITMLERLRLDKWGIGAKVMILTNLSDTTKELKSNDFGVIAYLIKSNLNLVDVVAKVKKELGK